MKIPRYTVITPVRNEGQYLRFTIDSMVAQTVRPQQWIIVDDGSTDDTARIALDAARQYSWITVSRRVDRGFRQPGGGVVDAFYDGVAQIKSDDWHFIVKLDGDLSFDSNYFEQCLLRFEQDPALGIAGGTVACSGDGALQAEAPGDPAFHVRGATKIYKRDCWLAIGGLLRAPGWDTLDEYKANMLGYSTYTFPELMVLHHRPSGGAEGTWRNWVKNGMANYMVGYHPAFMAAKCLRRAFTKPYGIGAFGLMFGFISGYLRRIPRTEDRETMAFLRRQQIKKLLFQESLWDRKPYAIL